MGLRVVTHVGMLVKPASFHAVAILLVDDAAAGDLFVLLVAHEHVWVPAASVGVRLAHVCVCVDIARWLHSCGLAQLNVLVPRALPWPLRFVGAAFLGVDLAARNAFAQASAKVKGIEPIATVGVALATIEDLFALCNGPTTPRATLVPRCCEHLPGGALGNKREGKGI